MTTEQRLKTLERTVRALTAQLDTAVAQASGMKKAMIALAQYIPISPPETEAAAEQAYASVKPASEPGGTPTDMQRDVLASITEILAHAGKAWPSLARNPERGP